MQDRSDAARHSEVGQFGLSSICAQNASELAGSIRNGNLSTIEVMEAFLDHIERVNPMVNAIVSLRPRRELLAEAQKADEKIASGEPVGPLHGLPVAIKDLAATRGLRTTFGSPIYADHVPGEDDIFVARMRAAGAIFIGKTNVPEFGYGCNSYNPVFGLTRNAYDPSRIAGGSSGGAAVALALRMLPLADGSDSGGSLRNPAAFNNVFGLRPSRGRVPANIVDPFHGQFATDGPMGRTVADVAMLLSVQAGYDARAPLSLEKDDFNYEDRLGASDRRFRFGWLGDMDGHLAMEPGVLDLCRQACDLLQNAGGYVEPARVDFDPERLWQSFVTLRHHSIGGRHHDNYADPELRAMLKPEAVWEIEMSHRLTGHDIYQASVSRGAWYQAMLAAFETYDFLLLPAAQVFPLAADQHWPTEIAGRKMDSYHRWMEVAAPATVAGCPAISIPAGFNADGLPTGLQIIGRPRADLQVLQAAAAYEKICPWLGRLPDLLG